MDYKVLKKIATIRDGKTVQIQLNAEATGISFRRNYYYRMERKSNE